MAQQLDIDPHTTYEERWGWRTPENYVFEPKKGLSREVVEEISWMKSEPDWMRKFRLKAFDRWERRPMPEVGRRPVGDRLQQHLLLPEGVGALRAELG